jgi:two-component system response regulator FixJ
MRKRPVYVVDDEEPIRRSVSLLLKVCGFAPESFDSGQGLLDAQSALDPGCVLLDVRMPDLDGIAVQRQLSERLTAHATIMMTGHGDVASAVAALQAGAVTFIEKPFSKSQLLPALDVAFSSIDQPETYQAALASARDRIEALSSREQSVLALLARDQSSEQIGVALQLSAAEIDVSRARILQQLGAESIPAALTIAFAAARAGG